MLWNFVFSIITQMMDIIFTNNSMYLIWNSIVRISFDAIFCLVTFVTFWCNVWVLFVTFLIYKSCAHSSTDRKSFTMFILKIHVLLKYQVTNWWLKNLLICDPIKKLIFSMKSKKKKKMDFPWNGPFERFLQYWDIVGYFFLHYKWQYLSLQ